MTFFEIIDNLIDVTGVPVLKQNGEQYEDARKLIHTELSTVEGVEIACYHEAGHWAQAVLALGADGSLFEVVGPRIKYDESKKNPYDPTPTGLSLPGLKDWKAQVEEDVKVMARVAVAGGESVHRFFGPVVKRGDKDDIERFKAFCQDARNRLGGIIEPAHIYLNEARENVRKDFENERFKNLVQSKAELVKKEVFRPVFEFHTTATQ